MNVQSVINSVRAESSVKRCTFVKDEASPRTFRVYPIEFCDLCGCETMRDSGPNYTLAARADVNRASMLADHIGELPTLGACDALGGIAVCPSCWTDEDPNEKTQPLASPAPLAIPADMPREFAEAINSALMQTGRNSIAAWFRIASGLDKG